MSSSGNELWPLPTSWTWVTMSDVSEVVGGGTPDTKISENFGGDIPWVTPADMSTHVGKSISGGSRSLTEQGFAASGARWLPKGAILFSSRAPIGYTAIASQPVTTNQGFKSFVLADEILPDYAYYWLSSAKEQAEKLASGTTFLEISGAKAALLPFPLAPQPEQSRIVEKLEELLSDLDAGVAELKAAQRNLAQYRQSLLKAAVEGALTADWRAAHGQPQESGADLLQRILTERRTRWEQKQLAKFAKQGKTPPKDWQTKYPEPSVPDVVQASVLPEGWVWASVEQLAELVSGHTPKDAGQFAGDDGSVQWFKVSDMNAPGNEESLVSASVKFAPEIASELGLKVTPAGTIVFPKRGGAIATNKKRRLGVSGAYDLNMMGLVAVPSVADWLWSWFKGVDLAKLSDGSNIPQINNPDIAPLHLPVPPAAEQDEIIDRLERALDGVVQQEAAVAKALKQAIAQRKNLLKAAFAGQLVPQDPNDEPASALLARIRAARDAKAGSVTAKRGRKAKETA